MVLTRSELKALSEQDVLEPIQGSVLAEALSTPPFLPTKVMLNVRDLGGLEGVPLRAGLAYRSGTLAMLAAEPEACPPVKRIFDFRTDSERMLYGQDPELDGVEVVCFEPTSEDTWPRLEDFAKGGGEEGLEKEYLKVLAIYQPTIRAVLEHVRDRAGEPFLFHCFAGRDRTGIVAGLLLSLAGASAEDIRLDYMLSRIGTEPGREKLLQLVRMGTGATSDDEPGFRNICNLRTSCWDTFVAGVERVYGGWEGYVVGELGFSAADVAKMRQNLTS